MISRCVITALLACSTSTAQDVPDVLWGYRWVNPKTKAVTGRVEDVSHYAHATPTRDGRGFQIDGVELKATTHDVVVADTQRIAFGDVLFEVSKTAVEAISSSDGQQVWTKEFRNAKPMVHDDRLWVLADGRLHALDPTTGKAERLPKLGDTFTPLELHSDPGLLVIQGRESAVLLDTRTMLVIAETPRVRAARRIGEFVVLAHDRELAVHEIGKEPVWRIPQEGQQEDAQIVPLGGHDVVVCRYCRIADSGVDLHRLSLNARKETWTARVKEVGIPHSKFRHTAYAVRRGDELVVVCQGPELIETLSLETGTSHARWRPR